MPVGRLDLVARVVASRDGTTVNVRVMTSRRAAAPAPVVAVMVTWWLPTVSFGSGTVSVSNAFAVRPLTWSPRLSESTAKVTAAPRRRSVPYARSPIAGRSETRYSGGDRRVDEERQPDRDPDRRFAGVQPGAERRRADPPRRQVVGDLERHDGPAVRAGVDLS